MNNSERISVKFNVYWTRLPLFITFKIIDSTIFREKKKLWYGSLEAFN